MMATLLAKLLINNLFLHRGCYLGVCVGRLGARDQITTSYVSLRRMRINDEWIMNCTAYSDDPYQHPCCITSYIAAKNLTVKFGTFWRIYGLKSKHLQCKN